MNSNQDPVYYINILLLAETKAKTDKTKFFPSFVTHPLTIIKTATSSQILNLINIENNIAISSGQLHIRVFPIFTINIKLAEMPTTSFFLFPLLNSL